MSPDVVNHLNMTPLHLAYAGHFCSVAQTLLTAGADPLLVDVANRSAGDVLGGSECVDGQVKKELNPPPPPREDPVSVVMWNRYLGSGWYSGLHNGVGMRCDFPVRNVTMSTEEFVLNHTSIYRPALVRGVIQNWPAWEHWTYSELQRRQVCPGYLALTAMVSPLPTPKLYSCSFSWSYLLSRFLSPPSPPPPTSPDFSSDMVHWCSLSVMYPTHSCTMAVAPKHVRQPWRIMCPSLSTKRSPQTTCLMARCSITTQCWDAMLRPLPSLSTSPLH